MRLSRPAHYLCALCGVAASIPVTASAYPYLGARPIESTLVGPTDESLSALHFNPAALRLLSGLHLQVSVGASGYLGGYTRAASLPAGFTPGQPTGPADTAQIAWATPSSLIAGSWDLGSESVTLAFGLYTPYVDFTRYAGDEDAGAIQRLSTRYHAISTSSYTLWGAVGAAVRVKPWLFLGAGFNFGWTRGRLHVLRDRAPDPDDGLGCGDPASCEQWTRRLDLRIDGGGIGYGFSAGVLYVPLEDRLWIGLSYTSPLICDSSGQVALSGTPAWQGVAGTCLPPGTSPSAQDGAVVRVPDGAGESEVRGGSKLVFAFPHLIHLGARLRLRPLPGWPHPPLHWEFATYVRLSLPQREDAELQLERRPFRSLISPQPWPVAQQVAAAIDIGFRQRWPRLELGQSILYESPRSASEAVSPANLESHKVDLSLSARVTLGRHVLLGGTVGVTAFGFPEGAGRGFDPGTAGACRASGYSVTEPACLRVQEGWGLPTAAGSYNLFVLHGGVVLEARR